jgi:hypothetical protein
MPLLSLEDLGLMLKTRVSILEQILLISGILTKKRVRTAVVKNRLTTLLSSRPPKILSKTNQGK